jgi:hypothetical protein
MASKDITFRELGPDPNTTIIAVIRAACKHLIWKSQKIVTGRKMALCLAKDDWSARFYRRCARRDLIAPSVHR